jgi:hypothetical protein
MRSQLTHQQQAGVRTPLVLAALLLGCLTVLPLYARTPERVAGTTREDFFIISSVDARKQQIVLKRPTEVTELVRVTDKTIFLDEQGKPLKFRDLRSGDTVYVTVISSSGGLPTVVRIRKGPMTLSELHRRYFQSE